MSHSNSPSRDARRELYRIVRSDGPFEQRAREALEVGRLFLGADNAHLTQIDPETDHWEAMVSTDSADGDFPPGLELDLEETYCRHTITSDAGIAVHDAPNQGWDDDPAFEKHELHCYHGTTLVVDGEPYGTVCFVATEPREPFSTEETMFAELVTRLLERELERDHYETALTRQTNLVNVLNRVLRHNLRNDMCVIRGRVQYMADQFEGDVHCRKALQKIDKLLALSEKARELESIVGAGPDRRQTDVVAAIESIADRIDSQFPSASLSVESAEAVTGAVLPSFIQAIEELLENAVKHSGEHPTVSVEIENVPNAIEVQITDDGPGLSESERKVLETGVETPLVHGSGLGLWLVHWIVTSHDGDIDATVSEDGTTMTMTIPRAPETSTRQQITELQQVRDRYEAVFEEAFDAMVIIDDDARIVDANASVPEIYGVEKSEALGRPIYEFLPDDFDFEPAWEAFKEAGRIRDTVTIVGGHGERQAVEYTATTDIVPGQHLLVVRERTEETAIETSPT